MARLSLSIDDDVLMDFPHVISSVEHIESNCRSLLVLCADIIDSMRKIGIKVQTEMNDTAQSSLARTTTELEEIRRSLVDLQESANDLVKKLKRIERLAGG